MKGILLVLGILVVLSGISLVAVADNTVTFGYNSGNAIAPGVDGGEHAAFFGTKVSCPGNGTLVSLQLLTTGSPQGKVRMALYTFQPSTYCGVLLAQGEATLATNDWTVVDVSSYNVPLTKTNYTIVFILENRLTSPNTLPYVNGAYRGVYYYHLYYYPSSMPDVFRPEQVKSAAFVARIEYKPME